MKFLLGTKEYMTQIFDENGNAVPVTAVKAGPVTVLQVKNSEQDGYTAVQVGFGERNAKNINKAQKGHFKENGSFATVREFKSETPLELEVGSTIDVSSFEKGDNVVVSGISKGKGFQGVVKRHGFAGGRRTHGQKHSEREPGSIGVGGVQRVRKGTKMAGRMGAERVSVKGLVVSHVDPETNTLFIKGAVPGRKGTLIEIQG